MSKKNRASLRRALLSLSMVMVIVVATIGGTIAWLTASTDVVTNTFTVGDIVIDLDEADVDSYGELVYTEPDDPETEENEGVLADRVKENAYKLLPGHTYTKDPIVYVKAESEPCYVFVKIDNDMTTIEAGTTIAQQMAANHWLLLNGDATDGVYYYAGTGNDTNGAVVDARNAEIPLPVFQNFTIKGDIEQDELAKFVTPEAGNSNIITIDAYAIQKDGSDTAQEAWDKVEDVDWNKGNND